MSNYKFWELTNKDGIKALMPYVEETILRFSQDDHPRSLIPSVPAEVGEPLARFVHGKMLQHARPLRPSDPKAPHPEYTMFIPASYTGILTYVREAAGGVLNKSKLHQLSLSLTRHLRHYRLIQPVNSAGSTGYWARPWPQSLKWEHQTYSVLVDPKTEKRIAEEADKPVKIYRSAKLVIGEIPEKVTPEWAVDTIKRMAKAFDSLCERYEKLEAELEVANTELEALKADPWDGARDDLVEVLG